MSTPWTAIITTQLVALLGLAAILARNEARWFDYLLAVVLVAYEVLVIRSLARRNKSADVRAPH